MKIFYLRIFTLVTIFAVLGCPHTVANESSSDSLWLTNFETALKIAKETKKPILLDFTGSDWCGWCIRLKKEVFSENSFKSFAKQNLVLVEVDFPRKNNQNSSLRKQNNRLKSKYEITSNCLVAKVSYIK